jgi:hypothetical protein
MDKPKAAGLDDDNFEFSNPLSEVLKPTPLQRGNLQVDTSLSPRQHVMSMGRAPKGGPRTPLTAHAAASTLHDSETSTPTTPRTPATPDSSSEVRSF